MELIRDNTVAALHRTMVVLRQELEMKNNMIIKLMKRKHHTKSRSVNRNDLHPGERSLLRPGRRRVNKVRRSYDNLKTM